MQSGYLFPLPPEIDGNPVNELGIHINLASLHARSHYVRRTLIPQSLAARGGGSPVIQIGGSNKTIYTGMTCLHASLSRVIPSFRPIVSPVKQA